MTFEVRERTDGCTFQVRVQPRSRRNEITGVHGDALKVRVTAPPTDGRANRALKKVLATHLDVAPSDVEIVAGHTSRQKRVHVTGASADDVRALSKEHPR